MTLTTSTPLPGSASRPQPAYKALPEHAFSYAETDVESRPKVLPPQFELRPTPADATVSSFSMGTRTSNSSWKSNLHVLVMGPGYAPIIGRGLRLAAQPHMLVFEIMYSSYSIFWDQSLLEDPHSGVQFYPAFLPMSADVNAYATGGGENMRLQNVVPRAPPGVFLAFGRLSGSMAVKYNKCVGLHSSVTNHPVVSGKKLFPAVAPKPGTAMQEGGIGFVVFRPDYETFGIEADGIGSGEGTCGQLFQLYVRCAFGAEALADVATQALIVREAVWFAIGNSPKDAMGREFVTLVHEMPPVCIPPTDCERVFEHDRTVNAADVQVVTKRLLASEICRRNKLLTWECALQEAAFQYSLGEYLDNQGGEASESETIAVEVSGECADVTGGGCARTVMHETDHRVFVASEVKEVYANYVLARQKAEKRHAASHCSPLLYYAAPPDLVAFGDRPVVVFGLLLSVRLGVRASVGMSVFEKRFCRRTAGDLGTRLMCDMMVYNPVLAVAPCVSEYMLSLFTDKAPGLLNVRSACRGTPIQATSTSDHRRICNAHPSIPGMEIYTTSEVVAALPVAPVPFMTREQADRNPFLRQLVQGGKTPYTVPGVEVSIYDTAHTCQTIVAGTRHSWPVKGAILHSRIMTPRSKEFPYGLFDASVGELERIEAIGFLFPPDHNSTACEIYSGTGAWSKPGTTHRKWKKPYGVDVTVMHNAMWWWYAYPAFVTDKTHPSAIDIWRLKQCAEAEIHWMGRWGRIIRQLLNKRRRNIRSDYAEAVFRNYYCQVNRVQGAPIADLMLSGINVFSKNLILGEHSTAVDDALTSAFYDDDDDEEEEGKEDSEDEEEDAVANDGLRMLYGHCHNDVIEVTTAKRA